MKTTTLLPALMLLLVTIFGCTVAPDKVAKKFLDAQERRDFKAMKSLSTAESQQMIDMLESLMLKDTSKPKMTVISIKNCETKDTTAVCTYCCDSEGKDGTVHMKKTADGWKVDMSKETLMGGKDAMDQLIRSSADTLKEAPDGAPVDTSKIVPAE